MRGGETEAAGERSELAGKKRFEDVPYRFLVHPDACIGDGEKRNAPNYDHSRLRPQPRPHLGSRLGPRLGPRLRPQPSLLGSGRSNSQLPTLRHGGAGILGKLHQDNRQLVGSIKMASTDSSNSSAMATSDPTER